MNKALGTLAIAACLLASSPSPVGAAVLQDTTAARIDSPRQDELPDMSQRRALAVTEPETPAGPLAPGTRYRFTRRSQIWSGAFTLADLLTAIPGVYVARGGFFGQPEYVMYGGRGAAAIELYWDGMPWHAMGGDSVYQDLGRITLSYLRQVDVIVLPGRLRVYLVSERHERAEPRTAINVTSGSFSTVAYGGLFQRRWNNGIGLNLAGDFAASDGAPQAGRNDQYLDLWAKVAWLPEEGKRGVVYQVRRQTQERDRPLEAEGAPARKGDRTDVLFKIFTGARSDRLGWGAETGLGSSSWRNDSMVGDHTVRQGFASVGYRRPDFNAKVIGRVGDARVRGEVEGRVSWIPVRGIVLGGEGRWQRFGAGRTARVGGASLGLYRGLFSATGQIMTGRIVQAPALPLDSGQTTTDASFRVGLTSKALSGNVGIVRRAAFLPLPIPDFPALTTLDSSAAATYIVADVRVRPLHPLFLTTWYSHPRTKAGDLQPPQHGRVDITFRSKFWRQFRSGVFEFMVRYGIEYWSSGTAGLSSDGSPIELPGATFHEWFVQVQLVGFKAFWNLRNARNTSAVYVPALTYPRNAQTFGVKWDFTN